MPRRSKARLMRARISRPPSSYHESSITACCTSEPTDMADEPTPRKAPAQMEPTDAAAAQQRSQMNSTLWKFHVQNRIVQATDDINAFFSAFIPAPSRIPPCPDKNFKANVPTGEGKEYGMYEPLVSGLTSLVRKFKADKRPKFINHAHNIMRFPFALCDEEQHVTKPDVIATIPDLPCDIPPLRRWRNVALVFEAKPCDTDDPMQIYSEESEATLIQLAKSARNIMLAQGRLYAFVIGIYGHQARIFRFDRSGAVCSPLFDYITKPHILHKFLWCFLHPQTEGCVVLGDDPTSIMSTHEDRAMVQNLAKEYDPSYTFTAENRKAVRRFVVTNEAGREVHYLAYKLIFVNPRLFSRGTTIWEAFELSDDDRETGQRGVTGKRVIIKEAWRQFVRPSEIGFYRAIQEAAQEAEESAALNPLRIAEIEYGDDLGMRETLALQRGAQGTATTEGGDESGDHSVNPSSALEDCFRDFPALQVPYSRVLGHRTVTASCRDRNEHNERGQMRLVMKTVGTPITDFQSTYEMVTVLRDAIEGHRQAYLAGIVHRDISQGNVMILRTKDGVVGFIHDFDYAFSWKWFLRSQGKPETLKSWEAHVSQPSTRTEMSLEQINEAIMKGLGGKEVDRTNSGSTAADPKNDAKQRTGTLHFMAVDVLDPTGIKHEARHDLESFFWLLVWIVLRHTAYVHAKQEWAWHELFVGKTRSACQNNKIAWLLRKHPPVWVRDNLPLTNLLENFRALCQRNHGAINDDTRMTHEQVLAIFNKYLANRAAWPEQDPSKPWVQPKRDVADHIPGEEESKGQPRSKGTLTYTSQGGGSGRPQSRQPMAPPPPPPRSDRNGEPETDTDTDGEMVQADQSERPGRRATGQRSASRPSRRTASRYTHSTASGSNRAPPSSESGSMGVHSSGYSLRSATSKKTYELYQSARIASRNMGPPPAPRTRSGESQSQSPRPPARRPGATSTRGSSATKRSRTRDDEEIQDSGDASSSKRSRTLSEPRSSNRSRKPRGKR
ncbi:hypothetical protein DAEQUDRAFT_689871 [Daedalea quercina L-15889]|uniref:Fungal-type protein kinase domain-containing protein n=1 Tax=Daedalea quercina L-15889 TaxID=1314783 RepID=A0A165QU26_9APHY|nr:hypothetical protein DAEQUDRAFT_689871 [Daedalea quercina L-15889]